MKSADASAIAHLAAAPGEVLRLARAIRITRKDAVKYLFTTHDEPLTIGAETFAPVGAGDHSNIRASDKSRGEGLDFQFPFEATSITEADVRAGRLDHALAELYDVVDWAASPPSLVQEARLYLGPWAWDRGLATVEARDLAQFLEDTVGEVVTADCNRVLGDAKCGVPLSVPAWAATTAYTVRPAGDAKLGSIVKSTNPAHRVWFKCTRPGTSGASEPAWDTTPGNTTDEGGSPLGPAWEAFTMWAGSGTVTGVTDARQFADTSLVEADDWWASQGLLTWLTGDNAGVAIEVESYQQSGGQVGLEQAMPNAIQVGDTYTISRGCDKAGHCHAVFDNLKNKRAPGLAVPGTRVLLTTPDASGL